MAAAASPYASKQGAPGSPGLSGATAGQRVALDGVKNAVTGQDMFLQRDEYPAYMELGAQFMEELRPVGARETQLAQKIIDLNWRLNTISTIENNLFHTARLRHVRAGDPNSDRVVRMTSKASAWKEDCAAANAYEKLGRLEMRVERTLRSTTEELERLQAMRIARHGDKFKREECPAWVWYQRMRGLHSKAGEKPAAAAVGHSSPDRFADKARSAEARIVSERTEAGRAANSAGELTPEERRLFQGLHTP